MPRALLTVFVVLGLACGTTPPVSPQPADAGALDAGLDDAGVDAGLDAGVSDAGAEDAGTRDAGAPDAGPQPDAGTASVPTGCVTRVDAGHHVFACDGIDYDVELPAACIGGGCGVILDVHGYSMTAALEDKSTNLRALAGPRGFVVVQPTAPLSLAGRGWAPGLDDPKLWSFLDDVRAALHIDPKRVHATGFSQGGAMTWRLLCDHADELASVAPAAAADGATPSIGLFFYALDCNFSGSDTPSREVPVLQGHGTLDSLVAYAKGVQQREAALSAWDLGDPVVVSTDADHTRTRYTNARGLVYEFVSHDALAWLGSVYVGGHCLPGGHDTPANADLGQTMFFSCAPPHPFVWGQLVLDFFEAHPKP